MPHRCTRNPARRARRFGCLLGIVACLPPALCAGGLAPPVRVQDAAAPAAAVHASDMEDRTAPAWAPPDGTGPDWPGIQRDTWYFLGYQFAAIGVLYAAPDAVSGWSEEQKDNYSLSRWADNVGNPTWDEDRWWINYVLHPYWGGAYYIRAQERGYDRRQSFLYSALLSTLFEFGAEALFEQPSYQDLLVTPLAGFLVGEYVFAPIRQSVQRQPGGPGVPGKALLILTDPLGTANETLERYLGVPAALSLQPYRVRAEGGARGVTQGWQLRLMLVW